MTTDTPIPDQKTPQLSTPLPIPGCEDLTHAMPPLRRMEMNKIKLFQRKKQFELSTIMKRLPLADLWELALQKMWRFWEWQRLTQRAI